ncbi:MAG: N-acetyl-alpha-D-glucosaminyl L-malate synthase BshA [Vicingus serpentipes]|nr:N-acetyl-alpha-D-glucosaminyl L-malate synthase BshA [Vicingus serpentipes]
MNIGIVCYPTFGGSGVVATELGKALAAKGHKIHFITYQQPVRLDIFSENIFYHEVKVSDYPLFDYQPYELVLTSKLVDVVKFEKLDILHVHYAIPHASAAYMAQHILKSEGIKIPFITTLHGTDITLVGKDASFAPVITFAINESNAVTAVSESLKQDTLKHFKVTREIKVIPNFICLEQYNLNGSIESLKKCFAPNEEKILIHVSNFRKVKRVQDVFKVFDIVRKKIPVRLLMVGDGPERHRIEELCRELDMCHLVKFLGKVKDTERVLAASDLFILPSESESFGLAALEAMAAKTPVISTNTGGIPEVNKEGVSGYLSNVGDVEDMAQNALKILSDEATLKRFKEGAYEQAKQFDIHTVLPQYEELYQELIEQ